MLRDWLFFPAEKQEFAVNIVVGLLGDESPYSNRLMRERR